jgi:hypothetical protein
VVVGGGTALGAGSAPCVATASVHAVTRTHLVQTCSAIEPHRQRVWRQVRSGLLDAGVRGTLMEEGSTLHLRQLWFDLTMGAPLPGGAWESGRAEPHRGRPDRALLHQPRYPWALGALGSLLQQVVVATEEAIGTAADTSSDDGRGGRGRGGGHRGRRGGVVDVIPARNAAQPTRGHGRSASVPARTSKQPRTVACLRGRPRTREGLLSGRLGVKRWAARSRVRGGHGGWSSDSSSADSSTASGSSTEGSRSTVMRAAVAAAVAASQMPPGRRRP